MGAHLHLLFCKTVYIMYNIYAKFGCTRSISFRDSSEGHFVPSPLARADKTLLYVLKVKLKKSNRGTGLFSFFSPLQTKAMLCHYIENHFGTYFSSKWCAGCNSFFLKDLIMKNNGK